MDFYNFTYLYANGYLDKFRAFFNNPGLTYQGLTAILKTFYKHKGWRMYKDDNGQHTVWYKGDLNNILENPKYFLPQFQSVCFNKWDKSRIDKEWQNEPAIDYSSDAEDMEKVSQGLISNDNYGYGKIDENLQEGKKVKRIFITESQYNIIKESEEKFFVEPEKVKIVEKYLDENFIRGGIPVMGEDGYPTTLLIVAIKGTDGQPAKNMDAKQLFYLLQDKFKNIYSKEQQRDRFLKQIIKDWFYKKIKNGLLSKNNY